MFGLLPWGLIIRGGIIALAVGVVFNWGQSYNERKHKAATEEANRRIEAQNADLAVRRKNFEMEVEREVQTAVSGITQSQDCAISDDVVKKLNRIGRR